MRFATTACVLLVLAPALASSQSLGEAARREQERRRRVEDAGQKARVITEGELNAGRTAPPAATKDEGAVARVPEGDEGAAREEDGGVFNPPSAARFPAGDPRRDQEDMWRQRMQEARNRVEHARRRHEALSELTMVPGKIYYDENHRAVITSVEQLQQLTAEALADVKAAEQAVEDLEESARRAGVPPGWLR